MSESIVRNRTSASERAVTSGRLAIAGKRRGVRALLPFIGPSMIAAIAYVDPGNYATNIQGGAVYGFKLLWVVLLANLMAMGIQSLSAKLGIATGKNLPEMCREHYAPWVSVTLWMISEVAAMATDVAEFLGASLGLYLLLHIPLLIATLITGIATYLVLMLERYGFRPLEIAIGVLLGVIALSYLAETIFSKPEFLAALHRIVIPWLGDKQSVLLAVGVVGATVMPHAVYLHSGLTQRRITPQTHEEAKKIYKFERLDVIVAMSIAGLVNLAMMYMAAVVFHGTGHSGVADITTAYKTLFPLLGSAAAGVFLVSLLASGLSSSAVGTMAGQVIMQGFVGFSIPIWIRRVVTMVPTVIIVALGVSPTKALILSQVVLSLALPAPLFSLVQFTKNKKLMGNLVNPRWVTLSVGAITGVILLLNFTLLYLTFVPNAVL